MHSCRISLKQGSQHMWVHISTSLRIIKNSVFRSCPLLLPITCARIAILHAERESWKPLKSNCTNLERIIWKWLHNFVQFAKFGNCYNNSLFQKRKKCIALVHSLQLMDGWEINYIENIFLKRLYSSNIQDRSKVCTWKFTLFIISYYN